MKNDDKRLDEIVAGLNGDNKEYFRNILTDANGLLRKVCEYAERQAKRKRVEPWSIIGDLTGHGSGVSSAIYQLYRWSKD